MNLWPFDLDPSAQIAFSCASWWRYLIFTFFFLCTQFTKHAISISFLLLLSGGPMIQSSDPLWYFISIGLKFSLFHKSFNANLKTVCYRTMLYSPSIQYLPTMFDRVADHYKEYELYDMEVLCFYSPAVSFFFGLIIILNNINNNMFSSWNHIEEYVK